MVEVQYYKARKRTRRFNSNQKVWVSYSHANHLNIYYRFRGNGRYVRGSIGRWSEPVGELKTIEVDDEFAKRIHKTAKIDT